MARSKSWSVMIFLDFKDLVASLIARSIKRSAAPVGMPRALAWILRVRLMLVWLKGAEVIMILLKRLDLR